MSTVIKAGQSFKPAQRLAAIDLADHLAEAERIIAEARIEARSIVAQSRREAAEAHQVAERRGFADGQTKGHAAGLEAGQDQALTEARQRFDQELGGLREALIRLIADLETSRRELLIAARQDALEFAIALARRVAKRVGELDRSAATANLEEALRLVVSQTDITVRSSTADLESLRRFASDVTARIAECRHISVVEDSEVPAGGCVVTTAMTRIDARIGSQMDEIAQLLLGSERAAGLSAGVANAQNVTADEDRRDQTDGPLD